MSGRRISWKIRSRQLRGTGVALRSRKDTRPHAAVLAGGCKNSAAACATVLDVAMLIAVPEQDLEYANAAAALAVLAGVAASDAACCHALRLRSRGQDHRQAVQLVGQVEPGGKQAANALGRLMNLKDQAHYGRYRQQSCDGHPAGHDTDSVCDRRAPAVSCGVTVIQSRPRFGFRRRSRPRRPACLRGA
jgi:hypothetical protein